MIPIAQNLWHFFYPLPLAGTDVRRNVVIIRLPSAEMVIFSSGPFSPDDVAAMKAAGQPRWLVDAMLREHTFANEARAALPDIEYLAPPGFEKHVSFPVRPIIPTPREWDRELLALELKGVPSRRETVFLHVPSRTLIVQDLVFNLHHHQPLWKELLLRVTVGEDHEPGMPRPLKLTVKNRDAFKRSLDKMLAWDFDRVMVGHGEQIETDGKNQLRAAVERAGF